VPASTEASIGSLAKGLPTALVPQAALMKNNRIGMKDIKLSTNRGHALRFPRKLANGIES
jgi:hypothetical protein